MDCTDAGHSRCAMAGRLTTLPCCADAMEHRSNTYYSRPSQADSGALFERQRRLKIEVLCPTRSMPKIVSDEVRIAERRRLKRRGRRARGFGSQNGDCPATAGGTSFRDGGRFCLAAFLSPW